MRLLYLFCCLPLALSSACKTTCPAEVVDCGVIPPQAGSIERLWNYEDPEGTRAAFEHLLVEANAQWPVGPRLELETQVARTYSLEGKFEQAHGLLDGVAGELPKEPSRARVRYDLERGRSFLSADRPNEARPYFLEAWRLASGLGQEFLAVDAAHMLGILEQGAESLDWNWKAIELAESAGDPRARTWLGALYNNTGWTCHDNGDYEKAMDLWQRAATWHARYGSPQSERIARWTVARGFRSLGKPAQALEILQGLATETEDPAETGYIHEELAENLLLLKRAEEARPHFQAAAEILAQDRWLVDHEPERLKRLAELGAAE
ncbi:MAG: tetratricopeptide repeat protein [Planctomycetota bacterium]